MENIYCDLENEDLKDFRDTEATDELDKKYQKIVEKIQEKTPGETYSIIGAGVLFGGIIALYYGTRNENSDVLLCVLGGIICAIGVLIMIGGYIWQNKKKKDPELLKLHEELEKYDEEYEKLFNVPKDSKEVNIIPFDLDELLANNSKSQKFGLYSLKIYKQDNNFCLYDGDCVLRIPFKNIKETKEIKKSFKFSYWMKDEPRNSSRYERFIEKYDKRTTTLKSFYQITIEDNKMKEWCILVPNYDMQVFNEILN